MEQSDYLTITAKDVPFGSVKFMTVDVTVKRNVTSYRIFENDKPVNTKILISKAYQYAVTYYIETDSPKVAYRVPSQMTSDTELIIYSGVNEFTVGLDPLIASPPKMKRYTIMGFCEFSGIIQQVDWNISENLSQPPVRKFAFPANDFFEWGYQGTIELIDSTKHTLPIPRVHTNLLNIFFSATQYQFGIKIKVREINWATNNTNRINVNIYQKSKDGVISDVQTFSFQPDDKKAQFAILVMNYGDVFRGYYTAEYFYNNESQPVKIPETKIKDHKVTLQDLTVDT